MSENIFSILEKRNKDEQTQDIPFRIFYDLRGQDFNILPDIIQETWEFKEVENPEDIIVLVGARGSGKSLLLKYQEHFFLETLYNENYTGKRVLPVFIDLGSTGFESKNAQDYMNAQKQMNETEFHFDLLDVIIEQIIITLKSVFDIKFYDRFKFWRFGKQCKEPSIKHIVKGKKELSFEFLKTIGGGLKGGNEISYDQKKRFSTEALEQVLIHLKQNFNIDNVKIIFDEVSTLSKSQENDLNTLLQQYFFDFIDICRTLRSSGLSFTIALLSSLVDTGSHFAESHAKWLYLDHEDIAEFSKLSTSILNKRISYYTDNRYYNFTDLMKGNQTENHAKNLLDQASTGIIRQFLYLCQQSYNTSLKNKKDFITQEIVRAVLNGYANFKEKRIITEQGYLYQSLIQTISKSKQNKFVFKSDDFGKYPSKVRKFIYDMFKNEFLYRKRSYIIFNQGLWIGSTSVKNKTLNNATISVIDYTENGFEIIGLKEEKTNKELSIDEEIALSLQAETEPDVNKSPKQLSNDFGSTNEDLEDLDIDDEGELSLNEIEKIVHSNAESTIADDLELKTSINFPKSHIYRIIKRTIKYDLSKGVVELCIEQTNKKTMEILDNLDKILRKLKRIHIKIPMIDKLESEDKDFSDMNILHQIVSTELELKPGIMRKISKDVLPNVGIGKEPAIRLLHYIEKWLAYQVIKASIKMQSEGKGRLNSTHFSF